MTATPAILTHAILSHATPFIGLREVKPNADWRDANGNGSERAQRLRLMMRPAPWNEGDAYCAAFCEGVLNAALEQVGATVAELQRFRVAFSPNCMQTLNNFNKRGLVRAPNLGPVVGSVAIYQHGVTSRGHMGFVATLSEGFRFVNIEANTRIIKGTEREGDGIGYKARAGTSAGPLILRGFITPAAILALCNMKPA